MGKLIVHTGIYGRCPFDVEIVGDIKYTDVQMSELGKLLRPYPNSKENRHVFTNNETVISGLRVAVKRKKLSHQDVIVIYHSPVREINPPMDYHMLLDADGNFNETYEGFMDQLTTDLMELL